LSISISRLSLRASVKKSVSILEQRWVEQRWRRTQEIFSWSSASKNGRIPVLTNSRHPLFLHDKMISCILKEE
jgi:hypothetical protein